MLSPPPTTEPDPLLDAATRDLLAAIDADPHAPITAAVQAPGGYGKSTLLGAVRRRYQRAGVPVSDGWTRDAGIPDVLLVDDAHLLADEPLTELRELALAHRIRLVLAYRPWPRSAALDDLVEVLKRDRAPLLLPAFTPERTAVRLARSYGAPAGPELVAFVQRQTGGVPRFVDRLVRALVASGQPATPAGVLSDVPDPAVTEFGPDLDGLAGDVRKVLLAAATDVGFPAEMLGQLLNTDPTGTELALAAARATGLLGRDDRLPPIAGRAVVSMSPAAERTAVWQRLAELQLQRGGPVLPLLRALLRAGGCGGCPGRLLTAAADEALPEDPALAADLLAAAAATGTPATARHAVAAALSGDLDSALRLADGLVVGADSAARAEAAAVAATALAHQGQVARSTEFFRWSGTPASLAFAAIGAFGTGDADPLERLLRQPPAGGPPTLLAGAATQTARGVWETLAQPPASALSTLVQAAALLEPAGRAVLLPDSPAAIAALVALHCGELDIADHVLGRALANRTGATLMARRHALLLAWVLMSRGECAAAGDRLRAAICRSAPAPGPGAATSPIPHPGHEPTPPEPPAPAGPGGPTGRSGPMESRDLLFAAALGCGIARRNSDLPALRRAWEDAREAVIRHPVDLFALLPLGEIAIAAARLGELGRITPYLRQADALLARLAGPALWTVPLHWSNLHAAIIAEQPGAADEHVAGLTRVAEHNRYAAALATAGQSWVEVLRGSVDPRRVEAAARGLHGVGLRWDGARLAGQAAIRTADRRAMTTLLECARMLQVRPPGPRGGPAPGQEPPAARDEGRLSDREREVADLVLAGLTYRQIGDRLFISAKTVEHHVARMRQRLGCANRGELLTRLRAMADDRCDGEPVGTPWPRRVAR